jgi:hypothetical protein
MMLPHILISQAHKSPSTVYEVVSLVTAKKAFVVALTRLPSKSSRRIQPVNRLLTCVITQKRWHYSLAASLGY